MDIKKYYDIYAVDKNGNEIDLNIEEKTISISDENEDYPICNVLIIDVEKLDKRIKFIKLTDLGEQ